MRFEWDENKSRQNLRKHDVRFETAALVFDDPCAITQRDFNIDHEERWLTLGAIGAGAILLETAEKWACKMRCSGMSVRSNVIRERAHGFYLKNGYQHYKTQKAFRKAL